MNCRRSRTRSHDATSRPADTPTLHGPTAGPARAARRAPGTGHRGQVTTKCWCTKSCACSEQATSSSSPKVTNAKWTAEPPTAINSHRRPRVVDPSDPARPRRRRVGSDRDPRSASARTRLCRDDGRDRRLADRQHPRVTSPTRNVSTDTCCIQAAFDPEAPGHCLLTEQARLPCRAYLA